LSQRLAVGAFSPSVLLRVARRTGRLDEHDLAVEEIPVQSSPAQFRSLLDRDLDAVLTSPDNVVAYRFVPTNPLGVTADVKIVSAIDRGLGLALYPRPGVTAVEQLRGATMAVDVPTSGFAFAMYALAESIGLRRDDYELVALGSTPKRLDALLAGRCDATMLNAGNELSAEHAGCVPLARVADVCTPYLGTVLSVAGSESLEPARRLAAALRATADDICAGSLDDVTVDEAAVALRLPSQLAERYVARLKDPLEGLVPDGRVDLASLTTVVDLRRRYLPSIVDGIDVLAGALDPGSGLVATLEPRDR
jgi:ABC-type nitrate/sulfonate/bicarbonate transport system substrate-binding protein